MYKHQIIPYRLEFKIPGGTSRGVLKTKDTFLVILNDGEQMGIGECALFKGLSFDDRPNYELVLEEAVKGLCAGDSIEVIREKYRQWPSIVFGLETAMLSLKATDAYKIFDTPYTRGEVGIRMNGLIWMGDFSFMNQQIENKLSQGYNCIKIKIGAIDFESEIELIRRIRENYGVDEVEIRVDANGAFSPKDALQKLIRLSELGIHSIEQPIRVRQEKELRQLSIDSPLDIALDEELIGVSTSEEKVRLLDSILPQFIILKPALVGGFKSCDEWISLAEEREIGWWVTSALESNIGLNAIAQFVSQYSINLPQGLGTGSLFVNNIEGSPEVRGMELWNSATPWDLSNLMA